MNRTLDVATSFVTLLGRLGSGLRVGKLGASPAQLLELYESAEIVAYLEKTYTI